MQPCRAYWMVGGHPNCGRCVAPACRSPAGRNNAPDRPGYASSLYPGLRVGPLRQPGQPPVFHRAGTGPSGTPLAISGTGKCGARHASATECFCPPARYRLVQVDGLPRRAASRICPAGYSWIRYSFSAAPISARFPVLAPLLYFFPACLLGAST